jgi:sulfatase modifying factor 1
MVAWNRADQSCFWIDETEVTVVEYRKFLAEAGSIMQEGACSWNQAQAGGDGGAAGAAADTASSFAPNAACVATMPGGVLPDDQAPISCIDWCDAQAYCQWAGKDLCRDSALSAESQRADKSDWFAVCSGNGANAYPYGANRSADACNGADSEHGCDTDPKCAPVPVETYENCVAGQGASAVYDLSGNVAEWTRGCTTTGASGQCNTRGGSFNSRGSTLDCATVAPYERSTTDRKVGFRCCAESG